MAAARRGLFITLEGGEGSGKSTVAAQLARRLRDAGHEVVLTEEPTGTPLGRHIWRYFQEQRTALSPLAELLLFEAARAEHVAKVVGPALKAGIIVVSDRFADSSIAYQGVAAGLGVALVQSLNETATGGLKPDLTLLLDVPPEVGLARARAVEEAGAKDSDAIGGRAADYHTSVREAFLAIARADSGRVKLVDATGDLEAVAEAAWRHVDERLGVTVSLDKEGR